jgi:chromosome segregation ATPase
MVTVLAVTGQLVLAAVGLCVATAVEGWLSWKQYRQVSVVRRRRRLDREKARIDTLIRNLERQVDALQAKRAEMHATVDDRRAARLEEAREEALYDRLKHHFIGEVAGVEGVTHKHVVRLKKAGIRTAYEASPERIAQLRTIGEKTEARIAMWRAALVAEYEDALPETLSPAEERRIERYVERRIDSIDAEVARAREKIRIQRTELAQVQTRRDEMPSLSSGRFARYLFRLDTLPMRNRHSTRRHHAGKEEKEGNRRLATPPTAETEEQAWWVRQP